MGSFLDFRAVVVRLKSSRNAFTNWTFGKQMWFWQNYILVVLLLHCKICFHFLNQNGTRWTFVQRSEGHTSLRYRSLTIINLFVSNCQNRKLQNPVLLIRAVRSKKVYCKMYCFESWENSIIYTFIFDPC